MITLGLIYTLIILTLLAFAIYEHVHAQSLSLPISPALTLLTILLPVLSAFNTAYLYRVTTTNNPNQQNPPKLITTTHSSSTITPNPSNPSQQLTHLRPAHARRPQSGPGGPNPTTIRSLLLPTLSQTLQTTQLVLSLILLSLATSSLTSSPFSSSFPNSGPGSIEHCALEQTWSHFFRSHDADTIRKIQDVLGCCGFRSPKHMSWPFPSGRNGQPGGGGGKGTEQCGQMWPDRKEGCANKWEGEFRGVMGGEIGVVAGVLVVQILGWGVGRWMATRGAARQARRGGQNGRATMGERGRRNGSGSGMGNGEGSNAGSGNNSWWNKLLQSFGVPHGDEEDAYRGLEDGRAQRRPLLGAGQNGGGHVGIEEVDDDDEDGEGRDVERGGSDEESRSGSERRVGSGYGGATSRVQPSGIHVADPWAEGN